MKEFSITVDIDAAPERVWAVMEDVERWHEWTPSVTSITKKERGPLKVGSCIVIRQPTLPPALWKIIELEPRKSLSSVTGNAIVRVTARHWLETVPAGTRVTLSIRFSGVLGFLAARLTSGINDRYLTMEANGLKQRSESAVN